MKTTIRFNTFETNSSSAHSCIICSEDEYKKIIHNEYYLDGYGDGIHSKEELKKEYKKVEDRYNDFEDFLEQNSYVKYSNWPLNDLEVEVTKKEINGQNVYAICAFGYDG